MKRENASQRSTCDPFHCTCTSCRLNIMFLSTVKQPFQIMMSTTFFIQNSEEVIEIFKLPEFKSTFRFAVCNPFV